MSCSIDVSDVTYMPHLLPNLLNKEETMRVQVINEVMTDDPNVTNKWELTSVPML